MSIKIIKAVPVGRCVRTSELTNNKSGSVKINPKHNHIVWSSQHLCKRTLSFNCTHQGEHSTGNRHHLLKTRRHSCILHLLQVLQNQVLPSHFEQLLTQMQRWMKILTRWIRPRTFSLQCHRSGKCTSQNLILSTTFYSTNLLKTLFSQVFKQLQDFTGITQKGKILLNSITLRT